MCVRVREVFEAFCRASFDERTSLNALLFGNITSHVLVLIDLSTLLLSRFPPCFIDRNGCSVSSALNWHFWCAINCNLCVILFVFI